MDSVPLRGVHPLAAVATYGPRDRVSNDATTDPTSPAQQKIVVVPKPLTALPSIAADAASDPESRAIAARITTARREHAETIARVGEALGGSEHAVSWNSAPTGRDLEGASLVITIGGDGTLLTVSRLVTGTPLFGVNSSPSTSTGHYCAATADTFLERLDDALTGRVAPSPLTRIAATVDGEPVGWPALNDVLFAHRSPVASTRYALRVADRSELQLSSGIWIATASGSTGAICSAGGEQRPLSDTRIQFRVREPYTRAPTYPTLTQGFISDALEIVSRSDKNALFFDGHPDPVPVPFGARARISPTAPPLLAFLAFRWSGQMC